MGTNWAFLPPPPPPKKKKEEKKELTTGMTVYEDKPCGVNCIYLNE